MIALVPWPARLDAGTDTVEIPARTAVTGPDDDVARLLQIIAPGTGIVAEAAADPMIRLVVDEAAAPASYGLVVDATGVTLRYGDEAGLCSAIATLRQLLPPWTFGAAPLPGAPLTLPHVTITDAPGFSWRGQHVDVARHFMPLDTLYRLVDTMHLLKLNVLHLHLTDDQGWRFPVTALPRLTEVGSWRRGSRHYWEDTDDGTPHGGCYTHDQLRALVAYAARRGIDVVPEIDLPGHVRALLAAYPEYGEDAPREVSTVPGIATEVLHLTDATMAAVETIVAELMAVFPSAYVHLGGDECPLDQWRGSDAAAELARDRGLDSVDRLQRWFTERMLAFVTARGRTLVGWDEILDAGPVPGVLVMAWRGQQAAAAAAAAGNELVVCDKDAYYFDYYASDDPDEPATIGGHTPWQQTLAHDPLGGVPAHAHHLVRGVQGQLWTEYMWTPPQLEYMAHPRMAVLAEVAWRRRGGDPDELAPRLAAFCERLDARGIAYRPLTGPLPWQRGGTGRRRRPDEHRG